MKKTALVGLMILFLGLVAGAKAQLPPPAWAQSYDLYAGQTILIGSVKVWNDDTKLYVYFDTTEVLLETHVHVGENLNDIPQTKKGNPIPGQFDSAIYYPDTHLHEFVAPPAGTELVIAAHGAMGEADSMTIVSEHDAGTVKVSTTGPDAGYGSPAPPVACWVHPSWPPAISGSMWISSAYYRETNGTYGSWRLFTRPFDVPGVVVSTSTMTVNSDNVEDVAINGDWVGTSEYSTDWLSRVYNVGTVTYMNPYGWQQVKTYPLGVEPGANTLKILMRNYPNGQNVTGEGTPVTSGVDPNPTGLTYKLDIDYYVKGETAWGEGTQFNGSNWATYMTYTVMEQAWDLTGDWVLSFYVTFGQNSPGGPYDHDMTVTSHDVFGDWSFVGSGGWPTDGSYDNEWYLANAGTDGNAVEFQMVYTAWVVQILQGYVVNASGTIDLDGRMSGTWFSSDSEPPTLLHGGTWETSVGSATPIWGPPSP